MTDDGQRLGIVTGACGPLGWAITRHLARSGMHIIAVDLPASVERREPEIGSLPVTFLASDLTAPGSADTVMEAAGRLSDTLDVLVNNAAFTGDSSLGGYACAFDEQTDDAFDAAVTLNLAVPFRLSRRLAPSLRRSPDGCIVNIASIYGLVGPDLGLYEGTAMGNPAGYAASKGGLVQLTRYLSTVLAPDVRVNCVAPGGLARDQDPTFVKRYEARTPLGRMGSEDDVASAVAWFANSASAYITGQTLAVDGGWTAW
jgi:NAD(P)-dependent dehydrogenase (short-subunit alcohol dehydrogenase family)